MSNYGIMCIMVQKVYHQIIDFQEHNYPQTFFSSATLGSSEKNLSVPIILGYMQPDTYKL